MERNEVTVVAQHLQPLEICAGPGESILVIVWDGSILLQLDKIISNGKIKFELESKIETNVHDVVAMNYFSASDIVILVSKPSKIQAALFRSEQVLWQYGASTRIEGFPLEPSDMSVCLQRNLAAVANGRGILVVKPTDGTIYDYILKDTDAKRILWTGNTLVIIQNNGDIVLYSIAENDQLPPRPPCVLEN